MVLYLVRLIPAFALKLHVCEQKALTQLPMKISDLMALAQFFGRAMDILKIPFAKMYIPSIVTQCQQAVANDPPKVSMLMHVKTKLFCHGTHDVCRELGMFFRLWP
jgi:hypothetical protein